MTGDSMMVGGTLVRLADVDAPELAQRCRTVRDRSWRCGQAARNALRRITGRSVVTCTVSGQDDAKRAIATCTIGDRDIAEELVLQGMAFAAGGVFASPYAGAEATARDGGRGVWQGESQHPADYRAARWQAAAERAPDGCPIKGRQRRGGGVFVVPWSPDYRQTRVRPSRGDRWFCSESEAAAAGWRPDAAG